MTYTPPTPAPEVTELDKKLLALAMAEDADDLKEWSGYLQFAESAVKLGWRPTSVDVTGKKPTSSFHPGHPGARELPIGSGVAATGPSGLVTYNPGETRRRRGGPEVDLMPPAGV